MSSIEMLEQFLESLAEEAEDDELARKCEAHKFWNPDTEELDQTEALG